MNDRFLELWVKSAGVVMLAVAAFLYFQSNDVPRPAPPRPPPQLTSDLIGHNSRVVMRQHNLSVVIGNEPQAQAQKALLDSLIIVDAEFRVLLRITGSGDVEIIGTKEELAEAARRFSANIDAETEEFIRSNPK